MTDNIYIIHDERTGLWCKRPEPFAVVEFESEAELLAFRRWWEGRGWTPMTERAPSDEGMKLVWAVTKSGTGSVNRAWYDGHTWHGSGSMAGVTHWMELPEGPT